MVQYKFYENQPFEKCAGKVHYAFFQARGNIFLEQNIENDIQNNHLSHSQYYLVSVVIDAAQCFIL